MFKRILGASSSKSASRRRDYRYRQLQKDYEAAQKQLHIYKNQLERQRLNVQYMKSNYEQSIREKKQALQKLEEMNDIFTRTMHSLAASELARARLESPEKVDGWSIKELSEFVVRVVKQREKDMYDTIKELKRELEDQTKLVEKLKQDLHALQESRINSFFGGADEEKQQEARAGKGSHEDANYHAEKARDKMGNNEEYIDLVVKNEQYEHNSRDTSTNGPVKSFSSPLIVESLDDISARLTNEHKVLIEIIGRKGVFRTVELKEDSRFLETFNVNSNYYTQKLQDLARMGFLETITVRIGTRGHVYEIFVLTEKGKRLYEALYGKQPVESQFHVLLRRHASPEHAIFVLDTKIAFERFGWEVDDTVEGNRVALDDGRVANFDLTIKKGGEIRRIECERGIQSDEDIQEKLNKWIKVSRRFFYVSPNRASLDKVKTKFFKWVASMGGRKEMAKLGVAAYFITLEDLKKGNEWEEVRFQ